MLTKKLDCLLSENNNQLLAFAYKRAARPCTIRVTWNWLSKSINLKKKRKKTGKTKLSTTQLLHTIYWWLVVNKAFPWGHKKLKEELLPPKVPVNDELMCKTVNWDPSLSLSLLLFISPSPSFTPYISVNTNLSTDLAIAVNVTDAHCWKPIFNHSLTKKNPGMFSSSDPGLWQTATKAKYKNQKSQGRPFYLDLKHLTSDSMFFSITHSLRCLFSAVHFCPSKALSFNQRLLFCFCVSESNLQIEFKSLTLLLLVKDWRGACFSSRD